MPHSRFLLLFLPAAMLFAQSQNAQESVDSPQTMQKVQERLDALERENRELMQEVRELRKDLQASRGAAPAEPNATTQPNATAPPLEDRVAVVEARTAEQA